MIVSLSYYYIWESNVSRFLKYLALNVRRIGIPAKGRKSDLVSALKGYTNEKINGTQLLSRTRFNGLVLGNNMLCSSTYRWCKRIMCLMARFKNENMSWVRQIK